MNTLLAFAMSAGSLHGLIVSFLILVVVLAIIGGLLWCINAWIHPLPPPVMLVIAVICAVLVILWAVSIFAPA